jgi:trimeric autotransporter adhesin
MRSDCRRTRILTLMMVALALIAGGTLSQARVYGRADGGAGALPAAGAGALAAGLLPDGRLDPAARGTFDPQGMTLRTADGGAPVFQAATSAITGTWDTRFADALPSSGAILVIFVAPNGDLYVGGKFGRIAGITATSVARWDGSSWSALGTDRSTAGSPRVNAIAVDGDDVYVGGDFVSFGGVMTEDLARWDGQSWHAVGGGFGPDEPFSPGVFDLAAFQGELLIAGDFTSFSGVEAQRFVRWDGTAAIPMNSGGFRSFSMVTASHGVYINAEDWAGSRDVLIWDGATLAPLAAAPIRADQLQVFADELYLFGRLQWHSGDPPLKLAKWDGASLITVTTDLPAAAFSFAIGAQGLYVGTASTIQRWTGGAWQPSGACNSCRALGVAADGLYAADAYSELFRYDGGQAAPIELLEPAQAVIAARDGNVYVGTFPVVGTHGSDPKDHLFRWKDGAWTNIWPYAGDWFVFMSPAIAEDGSFYFFSNVGPENPKLYRYRNNALQILPTPPNSLMHSIVLSGTELLTYDDTYDHRHDVYRWNGTSWSTIPGPTNAGEYAHRLFVFQGQIYMVTQNARVWLPPAILLSRWTGSDWVSVGPEMDGWIQSVAVTADSAYFGGSFQTADGAIRNIARWDGTTLHGMGAPDGFVRTVAASGTTVYVGGAFGHIDGCTCTNLGRWNGSAWEPLGSGTNGTVSGIAVDGQHVYVQGEFSLAGGLPAMGMSVWHEQHAQEPPPPPTGSPTPTATATATQPPTPTGSPAATATATAPTQTPVAAAERALFLPLLLR